MADRKTQYSVHFKPDVQTVNGVVVAWLQANGFVYTEKDGYKYYLSNDMISGARCFEYSFEGDKLVIYGYLKSPQKPFALDNGLLGAMGTAPYANLIKELINKISSLPPMSMDQTQPNVSGMNSIPQQPVMGEQQNAVVAAAAQSFDDAAEKRNGYFAIGAFCASLLSILLFFSNTVAVGGLEYVIIFTIAIMGLKFRKKKGFSIAALIITSISVLIFILLLV
jgi:hypothetical protein